jgi:hypothetical protein
VVHKEDVVYSSFVEEGELVQRVREFLSSVLGRPFEPFDALFRRAGEPEVAVQLGGPESVHCSGVECHGGLSVRGVSIVDRF